MLNASFAFNSSSTTSMKDLLNNFHKCCSSVSQRNFPNRHVAVTQNVHSDQLQLKKKIVRKKWEFPETVELMHNAFAAGYVQSGLSDFKCIVG